MDLRKVYEYALQREREGYEFFRSNAERTSHAAAAGVFRRLAEEEQKHIEYVQALLSSLDRGGRTSVKPAEELKAGGFFAQRASSEALDQTIIESMVPDVNVLRTAYLIERDFAEFYEGAAAKAEGEAKEALSSLAKWERGHERLFKGLHDKVYEEYMGMPWGG
jgi:rubrerythrin